MDFYIHTDILPKESGVEHNRKNWESPLADKMNDAYDFLKSLNHKGYIELYFDSKSQEFTIEYDNSKDLSKQEIDEIFRKIMKSL